MKKSALLMAGACLITVALSGCGSSSGKSNDTAPSTNGTEARKQEQSVNNGNSDTTNEFPTSDLSGIVPWKAGGGTDNAMRPLASLAGDNLNQSIVINNMAGASGATGMAFVNDQASDGYTLLMTAEAPCLYDAMDTGDVTFADFEQVLLVGEEKVTVVVKADSKYQTFTDLIDAALAAPGTITLPVSGPAAMGNIVGSMMYAVTGATFANTPSEGDADAFAQLLGGQVDCVIGKASTIKSYYENGDIRILAVINDERVDMFPDAPAVTEEYPDFDKCLPFSSFYSVSVKKDTPQEVVDVLKDAFMAAYHTNEYQDFLANANILPLGYVGEEADNYINAWRKGVISAMHTAGAIEKSPAELGLEE
ncbi:MAG: tripartite tricarboxylate transporter substrate binding protein [Lachnospiraceae bacterium]|nr:tripartite tricarboxylate transporter substrate binding protein [Lachnospiraceae bacterium]